MRKLFIFSIMAMLVAFATPQVSKAQIADNMITITPTSSAGVATYVLSDLVGKRPIQFQFLDSATGTFIDPSTAYSIPRSGTYGFSGTTKKEDLAWFNMVLYYQKNQSAAGTMLFPQYYKWQGTDTITTNSRYTSLVVITRQ